MKHLLLLSSLLFLSALACQQFTPSPPAQPALTQVTSRPSSLTTESARPSSPTPTATLIPTTASPERTSTAEPTIPPTTRIDISPEQSSAGDAYMPELGNTGYDVEWYHLNLSLDPHKTQIDGWVILTATATTDLAALSLDFVGFEIDSVMVNGTVAAFQRQQNKLLLALPQPLQNGARFQVQIAYHGAPTREKSKYVPFVGYLGMFFYPNNHILFAASEPDGARYWFPCNDHPRDKAAYRFEITVPQRLTAVANGVLLQIVARSAGDQFTWVHAMPLASAFVTIAVGEFERIESISPDGVKIRSYLRSDMAGDYRANEALIGEMVDWLSKMLGPYPFEEFGYVSATGLGASLETQTIVLLDSTPLDESILIHEMAHMWFGDWVSLDSWGEIWRSEGFATYLAYAWSNRGDVDGLENDMQILTQSMRDYPASFPLNNPPPQEMFGAHSYYDAAVLIHDLRKTIGDAAFFAGLKTYFIRFGGNTASNADFQAVMEEAAGIALDEFFAEWFK